MSNCSNSRGRGLEDDDWAGFGLAQNQNEKSNHQRTSARWPKEPLKNKSQDGPKSHQRTSHKMAQRATRQQQDCPRSQRSRQGRRPPKDAALRNGQVKKIEMDRLQAISQASNVSRKSLLQSPWASGMSSGGKILNLLVTGFFAAVQV